MNVEPSKLKQLIESEFVGSVPNFQPVAYYQKSLDQIHVQIQECSYSIIPVNRVLSLLESNYPKTRQRQVVGYIVDSISMVTRQLGWEKVENIGLFTLLESLSIVHPEARECIRLAQRVTTQLATSHVRIV